MKKIMLIFMMFVLVPLLADEPEALPLTDGVLRIVCFGDSITGDRPGKPYLHQYIKWTDILEGMLELDLGVNCVEVLNMGYAGDRTHKAGDRPGAVNRVKTEIIDQRADIAVILIGGNNMGGKQPVEEVMTQTHRDLTQIVRQVNDAGIKVLLVQYAEPKSEDMSQVWTHLDDVNPVIAAVAETEEVPVIALAPAFAKAEEKVPLNALLNAKDGVHLQPYGEIVTARTIAIKLKELGWIQLFNNAEKKL